MAEKTKLIAIIIPVFNGLDYTRKCLDSLSELVPKKEPDSYGFEIVVVDDGSSDGTSDWIMKNHPAVHLESGTGNLWWSGGINKGIIYALEKLNAEYILWWNNDIQPAEDYFRNVIDLIDTHDENTIIGSKIYVLKNGLIWGMGGRFNPVTGKRHMYGERQADTADYQKPIDVDWFPGMGTIIHRSVFDKISLLDEKNFPQYHGDSDYTFRARKAGLRLIAFPQLVIYNDDSNTGLIHKGKFSELYESLTSIKSNYNLKKDIAFFRKHSTSPIAYAELFRKYFMYIGGFCKWKILNSLGIYKTSK